MTSTAAASTTKVTTCTTRPSLRKCRRHRKTIHHRPCLSWSCSCATLSGHRSWAKEETLIQHLIIFPAFFLSSSRLVWMPRLRPCKTSFHLHDLDFRIFMSPWNHTQRCWLSIYYFLTMEKCLQYAMRMLMNKHDKKLQLLFRKTLIIRSWKVLRNSRRQSIWQDRVISVKCRSSRCCCFLNLSASTPIICS